MPSASLPNETYTVGWICALPLEAAAAAAMLDETHEKPRKLHSNDHNIYTLGRIGEHNVVIACLPAGVYGTNTAATVATQMLSSFESIRVGLMVGIGGGVPGAKRDIQLGDVVMSKPGRTFAGVVQYDRGKTTEGKFERTGSLNKPPQILLSAVSDMEKKHMMGENKISEFLADMLRKFPSMQEKFSFQSTRHDSLHANHDYSSNNDNTSASRPLKGRKYRSPNKPIVHYGLIASGNQVIKDATTRDKLVEELGGEILCFEMEAAGLMDAFPCVVIRGICDYADYRKNDLWQGYAAAIAAACAKELLSIMPSAEGEKTCSIAEAFNGKVGSTQSPKHVRYNNVPQRIVTYFITRTKIQDELDHWLQEQPPPHRFVLQGMGGSGKSQLALWCCSKAKVMGYTAILWINASSPETLIQGYRSILKLISPESEGTIDDREASSLAQDIMSRWTGRWLLVFDNFDDPGAFASPDILYYIPSGGGHILFTSRDFDSTRLGRHMSFSQMSKEESVELLLQRPASTAEERLIAEEIASTLGFLALALDQAGAYIRSRGLSLAQFTSHYERRTRTVLEEVPKVWEYRRDARRLSAFTTWEMSLDLITGSPREKEYKVHFLTLAAFMNPQCISEKYFRAYSSIEGIEWLELFRNGKTWDSDKFDDLLMELRRLSLLQILERRGNEASFSIHPLICDWVKLRQSEDIQPWIEELANILLTFLRNHSIALPADFLETSRHFQSYFQASHKFMKLFLIG